MSWPASLTSDVTGTWRGLAKSVPKSAEGAEGFPPQASRPSISNGTSRVAATALRRAARFIAGQLGTIYSSRQKPTPFRPTAGGCSPEVKRIDVLPTILPDASSAVWPCGGVPLLDRRHYGGGYTWGDWAGTGPGQRRRLVALRYCQRRQECCPGRSDDNGHGVSGFWLDTKLWPHLVLGGGDAGRNDCGRLHRGCADLHDKDDGDDREPRRLIFIFGVFV